jgi:hypothetical protein
MKKVVFILLLVSIIYSFEYSAKARLYDGFYSLGIERNFYVTEQDTFLCDFAISNYNSFSLAFDAAYINKLGAFSLKIGAENLLVENKRSSLFSGVVLPIGLADLEIGMCYKSEKLIPYCSFSYNLGPFLPYIKVLDQLTLGLNYGFDYGQHSFEEYFKMVYPIKDLDTNKKTIIVKGYFLDTGKIFLNGEEMPVRADGMFNKTVNLSNNGSNYFSITMDGKSIGKKSYNFTINRKYQFYDLDIELQNRWGNIINLSGYPKGDEFLPEQYVTKGDFYLALGKIMGFGKKGYIFKEYFVDVFDPELKKYLYDFYGKGYMINANVQFVPEKPILRREAFIVLSKILPDTKDAINNYNFVDVPINDVAYPYLNKLMNNGILDSLLVNPNGYLTRADFYKYIYVMKNYFELLKDDKIERKQDVVSNQIIDIVKQMEDFTKGEVNTNR